MSPARRAPIVAELLAAIDQFAPLSLAAEWDNVGLIAGRRDWPARRVLVALDLTDAVAREAIVGKIDALVLYHPPIFREIKRITENAPGPTSLLPDLLAARTSLLAVHTALDAAAGGTNDLLLDAVAAGERAPLEPLIDERGSCKLAVFVAERDVERLRTALSDAGAGVIGHYRECSFSLRGQGTFRGDETTNPVVGKREKLEIAPEVRLEMVLPRARVGAVVRALYAHHPYEEPAFDLYPVQAVAGRAAVGHGRVGRLDRACSGKELAARLDKSGISLAAAQVVGDLRRKFTSVTAAAGSFGVRSFQREDSLVLTGEFKHHDALDLLARGITAVALGHYASEAPVLRYMATRLKAAVRGVDIRVARACAPPLRPIG